MLAFIYELKRKGKKQYRLNNFKITINPDMKVTIKSPMNLNYDDCISHLLGFGDEGNKLFKSNEEKLELAYQN